jgi:hypothetical protein
MRAVRIRADVLVVALTIAAALFGGGSGWGP